MQKTPISLSFGAGSESRRPLKYGSWWVDIFTGADAVFESSVLYLYGGLAETIEGG